jgi:hypothetical protein
VLDRMEGQGRGEGVTAGRSLGWHQRLGWGRCFGCSLKQKNILSPMVIEPLLPGCLVHCLITILTGHFSLGLILTQDSAFDTTIIRHQELETLGQYVTRLQAGQQVNLVSFAGRGNGVFSSTVRLDQLWDLTSLLLSG